ncbi:adenylate/guanylate cyclase domain-containing protein, partial [Acidimicrobiaceae bacterium AH-315-P05]|nr:adenylate/guanylate cyclase domain-containing protein [Acidimicrobiaceae bacterium AH-315-P05]
SEVVVAHDGLVFKHTGDGIGAVFGSPQRAAEAAIEIQRRLQADDWGDVERLKIRIGLHMGDLEPTGTDYFGPTVNRAARVMDVANGDQIAISSRVSSFVSDLNLRGMGEHQLKGIGSEVIDLVLSPLLNNDARPLRSRIGSMAARLPPQLSELIGRQREVEEVAALVEGHRAVSILGPGGVGKTRLAVDVGHLVADHFVDGVVMCDLVPLRDGDAVPDAVAESLGARAQPGMSLSESIVNFVQSRQILLVLDNCEHVASAVSELVNQILRFSESRILATSREPVGFDGEQLFGLLPLDAVSGVELFITRAVERDHSFAPTATDRDLLIQICDRLDGIPLGIELAAAWSRVLAPADLLGRLHDRFQVLRGGRAGGRHQTLRDTVQWSYEQLDAVQVRLFERLSVFAGGFSLEAVEAVCVDTELVNQAEVLDTLMALVDKSMVMSERGVGHVRFKMLGTLGQFAQERLDQTGESELFRSRHAQYFAELATNEAGKLISPDEAEVWETLDREWANLRSAFDTRVEAGDHDGASEIVVQLGWFAIMSMRFEIFTWLEELFSTTDVDQHGDAGALYGLRALRSYFTVDDQSVEYAMRGLEIDQTDRAGYCRMALAAVSLNNVHSAIDSETFTRQWLEHLDDSSPTMSRVWAEGMRAFHICSNQPSPDGMAHAQRVMDVAKFSDSATAMGVARWAVGMATTFEGIGLALAQWRRGRDAVESLGPSHLVYHLLVGLELHFSVSHGDLEAEAAACLAALERSRDQHYLAGTSHLLGVSAIVLSRLGQARAAAVLLGAMEANGHLPRENAVWAVGKALGDDVEAAKVEGASMSGDAAATMAMELLREAITTNATEATT